MTPILEEEVVSTAELDRLIPLETRLSADEAMLERERRLTTANKELSLALAKSRTEYKRQITNHIGAAKISTATANYNRLRHEMATIPNRFAHTPEGEKLAIAELRRLAKEKHELYHGMKFDVPGAIAIRKESLAQARAPIGKLIALDQEVPQKPNVPPPRLRDRTMAFAWKAAPYQWQWSSIQVSDGSGGYRNRTANGHSTTGEIDLTSTMQLYGADDSDYSRTDTMAEVGFWYQMPAAGLIEAWVFLQDIQTDYAGSLYDESGCSNADIEQLNRVYIWTSGSVERYSTLVDYRRGESEGHWSVLATNPGTVIARQLFSQKSYAAGEWVLVTAGVRDFNYFWVDDMSCTSQMVSRFFVKNVAIRSTGG